MYGLSGQAAPAPHKRFQSTCAIFLEEEVSGRFAVTCGIVWQLSVLRCICVVALLCYFWFKFVLKNGVATKSGAKKWTHFWVLFATPFLGPSLLVSNL